MEPRLIFSYLNSQLNPSEIAYLKVNFKKYACHHDCINIFISRLVKYSVQYTKMYDSNSVESFILLKLSKANFLSKKNKNKLKEISNNYVESVRKQTRKNYTLNQVIKKTETTEEFKNIIVDCLIVPETKQDRIILKMKSLKYSAARRKIPFNLTYLDVEKLLDKKTCYYTGARFSDSKHYQRTVDRIDSNKGYVSDNVVACIHGVNSLKNYMLEDKENNKFTLTVKQFKKMAKKL